MEQDIKGIGSLIKSSGKVLEIWKDSARYEGEYIKGKKHI